MESRRQFLKELKTELPFNAVVPLLGIYLEEYKSFYRKDTCTQMFITIRLTTANTWNQPKRPPMVDCIKKMWYIPTMENYAAIKKKDIISFAGSWMELGAIILSKLM